VVERRGNWANKSNASETNCMKSQRKTILHAMVFCVERAETFCVERRHQFDVSDALHCKGVLAGSGFPRTSDISKNVRNVRGMHGMLGTYYPVG